MKIDIETKSETESSPSPHDGIGTTVPSQLVVQPIIAVTRVGDTRVGDTLVGDPPREGCDPRVRRVCVY